MIGYRSFGRGSTVVLIQGYAATTMDDWDPRLLDLLARTHRVVEFDNRGIGRSTGTIRGLTLRTMAADADGVIRALHLNRPTVLGHSLGGQIAEQFAVDHPRDLSRLVLTSTWPGGTHNVYPPPEVLARLTPPIAPGSIDDLLFSTKAAAAAYTRSINRRGRLERVPVAVQRAQLDASVAWQVAGGVWDRLPALRVPTLVAVGTQDRLVPPENGARIAASIRAAQLVKFPGLRHNFLMERADKFVSILNRFITSHK